MSQTQKKRAVRYTIRSVYKIDRCFFSDAKYRILNDEYLDMCSFIELI